MSAGVWVMLMVTVFFIAAITAGLIAEHHHNKRNHIAAGTDRLLVRLSAQCNARPPA